MHYLWISCGGVTLVGNAISIDEELCEVPFDTAKVVKKKAVDHMSNEIMVATNKINKSSVTNLNYIK